MSFPLDGWGQFWPDWLGVGWSTALLGDIGPVIAGIPIIPALIGAIILAFIVDLIAKNSMGRREITKHSRKNRGQLIVGYR